MHPILFKIGPLTLHSYGLLLAAGCIAGIWRASRISARAGLSGSQVVDSGIVIVLVGLVGARITYVALNWPVYRVNLSEIASIWDGGLTFLGGFAAGVVAGFIWARISRVNVPAYADLMAPSIALAYGIARLGCFLNGCCYGYPTSLPWAVCFHADGGPDLTPGSHPVQVYSSILSLLIFWLLTRLEKRGLPSGSIFGSWLVLAGFERFFLENFRRGVTAQVMWGNLTQAQVASLALILAGAVIILLVRRPGDSHV